ncbi:MAG: ATP-dependent DNA ligase [Chloroflexi bacterium]|nr:ATP-dependent DNA ligase [Chloroflexota bacterium]
MSLFYHLTDLGDALAATKKKLVHRALISEYLKTLPPDEIAIAARLLIGRVFPESDPRILNISGSAIDRALEQITGTPLDWNAIERAVDVGDAVEKWLTLRQHQVQGEPLQVLEVYQAYEAIAQDTGAGSQERKDARLRELLARATPRQAKYIVKHVVRDMRVGVGEGTLLDAIAEASKLPSPNIRRANQVTGDVGEVARIALTEGEFGLARLSIQIFVPLKPMLAQTADDVADAFAKMESKFALEYKFDGARVQIHKRGDDVRLYSRQLSDITDSLPEIVDQVRREIHAREAIIEGEVIALASDGKPLAFQEVMRRFGREREIEAMQRGVPVRLYLFDVLLSDGAIFLERPNAERWEKLQTIRGDIDAVERVVPNDVAEGERFLKQARSAGHEGLMAKNLASPYMPGERGKHWLKIKPVITLDLAIVGAEWGYGRRTGWLSNVHLAARDETTGKLVEVGRTFKGLTDAEFKSLTEKLLADKISETRGTVWVKPSIVVEVAFNNVQRSPRYPGGVALRLAHIINFRPDKSVGEIETIQRLQELM